jgi:hypothetical protein
MLGQATGIAITFVPFADKTGHVLLETVLKCNGK